MTPGDAITKETCVNELCCCYRLEDANSTNNKLVHNLELREKKVESLEQR